MEINTSSKEDNRNIENTLNNEINLNELFRALLRRKKFILFGFLIFFTITIFKTAYDRQLNPIFSGSFSLLIKDPLTERDKDGVSDSQVMLQSLALNNSAKQDLPTLIELLKSEKLTSNIAQKYGIPSRAFSSKLFIRIGGGSERNTRARGIINVSYASDSRGKTLSILEDLSKKYLKTSLEQRQKRLTDGLDFLNRQAPQLESKTSSLQQELAVFREKNNLIDPIEEGRALKERLINLDSIVLELESNRDRLIEIKEEIEKGNLKAISYGEQITNDPLTNGISGGLIISGVDQSLLSKLLEVEEKLSNALTIYTDESVVVSNLRAKLTQIEPIIKKNQIEAVNAALESSQARLDIAKSQLSKLNEDFLKQPKLIKEYGDLLQSLEIAQNNLTGLVTARENFQLEMSQDNFPWIVISEPKVGKKPVKPSIRKNMALGIIFGIIFGVILALIRDRFDHVFHNPKELEELGLPNLGHIPYVKFFQGIKDDKRNVLKEILNSKKESKSSDSNDIDEKRDAYDRFFYQEAFRNLSASIRFLNTGKERNIIALTSSIPSEGKSLVNILLCKTVEEMGQKILLIDSDLRKPQLHSRLGLNNVLGLSNYLTDSKVTEKQIIQNVPNHPNWQTITAGRSVPDPTRLLSSDRLDDLLKFIDENYKPDFIIFDTPPALGLADASLVSRHCNGILLLISIGKVDRNLPKDSLKRLTESGAKVLGYLTNSINQEKTFGNLYGYGNYGYGYKGYGGYGYYKNNPYANYYSDDIDKSSINNGTLPNEEIEIKNIFEKINFQFKKLLKWLDN